MIIRPLAPGDREAVRRILVRRRVFNEKEIPVALEVLDAFFEKGEESGYEAYGCFAGTDLAGYVCFGAIPMTDGRYDLYWIAVDEKRGGQGVGSSLLRFVEAAIRERGGGKIYVETSSTDPYGPARAFYGRHGYAVAAVLGDFYRTGDDKVVFLKDVTASEPFHR